MNHTLLFPALLGFLASLAFCGVSRPVLRRFGVIDRPNARSSHTIPTVRGLGAGIVTACLAVGAIAGLGAWPVAIGAAAAGAILAVVSFVDDIRPVSPRVRFLCHAFAAAVALALLADGAAELRAHPFLAALFAPVAFLFVAGYTNAFNFMDGINGIAGFQGMLTAAGTAWLLLCHGASADSGPVVAALVIAGACAGFLPHNFPRARGFMGDVASATLGYWLAALALWGVRERGFDLLLPLSLLHANFILDTGITLVRRKLRGERLSQAHREHFYQRMVRSGASHTLTTGIEATGVCLTILLMRAYLAGSVSVRVLAVVGVCALWGAFFLHAERRFVRSLRG